MSATELVDYGFIILCIYRPPDSNFIFGNTRTNNAENTVKKRKIFLCVGIGI